MNDNDFWDVIGKLDWGEAGDDGAVVEPVVDFLATKTDDDIFRFEELLSQKLHALDTKAHAKEIGEDALVEGEYFSPDWFLYARCVVVANGKELFELVLRNPKEFPKDTEFEAILSVAQEAYEKKNDKDWEYTAATSYETGDNLVGWGQAGGK